MLYTTERLAKISAEVAKENSVFTLDDRLGLVHDSFALSKAGLSKLSSSLTLIDNLRNEKECEWRAASYIIYLDIEIPIADLVWAGMAEGLSSLVSIWWEHPEVVAKLDAFRRVSCDNFLYSSVLSLPPLSLDLVRPSS